MRKIVLLFIVLLTNCDLQTKNIAIIGCGYVGLTLASILVNEQHSLICIDIDEHKIDTLNQNILPIYEPGLENLLFNSPYRSNLVFTTNFKDLEHAEIIFLCTPTPTDNTGKCNLSYLISAFNTAIRHIKANNHVIVCIKSTIPPGTIQQLVNSISFDSTTIDLIYNPEFMREGSAIYDIYSNNPIVIGSNNLSAINTLEKIYTDFLDPKVTVIKTTFETAELIKYAWNSFSAIRIAYINELATLSRLFNANISTVVQGVALSEKLLPTKVLKPGPGFGGSCLPKDATSFSNIIEQAGFSSSLVHQAIASNNAHKQRIINDIINNLSVPYDNQTVTILGLSFKAATNDIRHAPSLDVIQALLERNVIVNAYDPQAINDMKKVFPSINYFDCPYEASKNSNCIVILTEWPEIKMLNLVRLASLCNKKIIIDTRNLFDPSDLKKNGFVYVNMGLIPEFNLKKCISKSKGIFE